MNGQKFRTILGRLARSLPIYEKWGSPVPRILRRPKRNIVRLFCFFYLRIFKHENLSKHIRDVEILSKLSLVQTPRLRRLLAEPINCLDVGARGGIFPELKKYEQFFKFYLIEPDPDEARELRKSGHAVVDKLLGDKAGSAQLNITRKPGNSSVLEPSGEFMPFYKGESARFDVVKRIKLDVVTIEEVAGQYNVRFDAIKTDTQGSDLAILQGMGDIRPLFIITEIVFGELYIGQPTLYETGLYLKSLGYVACDIRYAFTPVPIKRANGFPAESSGLPLHGDAYFMPNWNSTQGRYMIINNDLKWAALMLIFGMEDIVLYVMSLWPLPHEKLITESLKQKPKRSGFLTTAQAVLG